MPDEKVMLVQFLVEEHEVSQRQACKTLSVSRSTSYFQPKSKNDMPVIQALEELVAKHPAIGFWQSHFRLINILDDYDREMLTMEVDFLLPAQRVVQVLEFLELIR